jgi:hypothetical protein
VAHEVAVLQHGSHNTFVKNIGNLNANELVTFETLKEPPPASLAKGF